MVDPRAMGTIMDGLIAWAGAIIDLIALDVPEEYEESVLGTVIELVAPAVAISPMATINDNDN